MSSMDMIAVCSTTPPSLLSFLRAKAQIKKEMRVEDEVAELLPELTGFWRRYGVQNSLVGVADSSRYFHVQTPSSEEQQRELEAQLRAEWSDVQPVRGLAHFYRVSSRVTLSHSRLHSEGTVCGMDVTGGAVVQCGLQLRPGQHVLDLCCAPGMKMLLCARAVAAAGGTVTGVDCSADRISTTRSLLRKLGGKSMRLFCADGTRFSVLAPPDAETAKMWRDERKDDEKHVPVARNRLSSSSGVLEEWPKAEWAAAATSKKKRQRLFDLPGLVWADSYSLRVDSYALYDRVMVDADCTTDGAMRHHLARARAERDRGDSATVTSKREDYRSDEDVRKVCELQRQLLFRGWDLLKPGGILVYCTCSLLREENEDVVLALLNKVGEQAAIEPLEGLDRLEVPMERSRFLADTCYFRGGNILYAARIRKQQK